MGEVKKEIAKFESELAEIQKKLAEIDNNRNQVVRVGVRIEGILAYLRNKEQELLAELKKDLSIGSDPTPPAPAPVTPDAPAAPASTPA